MTLREKQSQFVRMLARLFLHAELLGYELTLGRGYASKEANAADGGHKRSLHLDRLAQDLNVFVDGQFLRGAAAKDAHNRLHDYWDEIGGAERIAADLNHYSLPHGGMR